MGLIHTHAGETNIFLGNVGIGAKPNERFTVAGSISANNTIFGKAISSGNYLGTWRGDPLSSDQVVVESIDLKTTNISGGLILQADGKGGIEFVEASSINANNNIEGDLTVTGFISAGGNLSANSINAATSIVSGGLDLLDIFGAGGAAGGIGGCGAISFIPKFTSSACIGNSIIRDTGTTAVVGGNLSATGNLDVDGNSTILGNLSVHGDMHYIDTNVTVTSALSVVNTGTGPALFVRQDGSEPIAHFIDKDGDDIVFADDGKLGIGTFTPGEKISVIGNISACGVLYGGNNLCVNADSATNAVIGQSRIGNYISDAAYFSHFDYGTSTNYALNQNSSGNTSLNAPTGGNVKIKINNSPKVTVDSAGNVGINTTTPGETFVVDGRTCISGNLSAACITTCKIFDYTLPASYYLDPSATSRLNVLCLAGYACFSELRASTLTLKGNLSSCGTGVFKSLSAEDSNCCNYFAGNVGIGRANSLSKLHVGPNSLVAGYTPDRTTLAVSDTADGAQLILRGQSPRIWFDTTSGGMAEMYLDCQQLNILQGTPSSAGSSRFYIKAGGDVGIGTTTPAEKLTVAGNISANGGITAACSCCNSTFAGRVGIGTTTVNKPLVVDDSGSVGGICVLGAALLGTFERCIGSSDICLSMLASNADPQIRYNQGTKCWAAGLDQSADSFVIADGPEIHTGSYKLEVGTGQTSVYGNLSACGSLSGTSVSVTDTSRGFVSAGRDLADIFQVEPGGVDGSGTACFLSKWTDSDTIGNSIICANSTTATVCGNATVLGDFCSCALSSTNSSCDNYFAGNVGFGITTPSQKLHVCGTGILDSLSADDSSCNNYFAGNVGIGIGIPSAPLHVACLNGISTLVIHRDGNDPTTNTALNRISFKTDFSSVESDVGQIDVCTNCSTYRTDMGFSVKSTGGNICRGLTIHGTTNDGPRIGIGTTTPDKTFVVRGTDAEVVIDDIDSTDTPRLRFRESGNTSGQVSTDSCNLRFFTQSSERMRLVNSTGNVGIGTTNPAALLSVGGGNSAPSLGGGTKLIVDMTQGAGNYASMSILAGNAGRSSLFFGDSDVEQRGAFDYRHADDSLSISTAAGERMRILSDGSVGIGTTNPAEKLSVYGNISASGSICTAATTNGFMSAGRDLADIFETCSSSVDGSGTAGKLPVWTDSDTLGDSPLSSISGGISIDNDNSNGLNITTSCTVDKIRSDASFLVLEGDNVILRNCGGTEDYGKFQENGAVLLYHNNVQKFETTSAGITINGSISSKGYCSDVNNNTFLGTNALSNSQAQTCNTAVGCGALECNTTGNTNVAVGACAIGFGNDGCYNVAVGEGALCKVTGNDNVAVGRSAMRNNTSGVGNTAVGRIALLSNTTASGNVGVGCAAGCATTTGFCNTSVGTEALRCNTTGCNNTAIGRAALRSQTTASNNVAVGQLAGVCNTTGCCNTVVGVAAMTCNTTGIKNVALGYQSLYYNLTSSNNIAIGNRAIFCNTTGTQNIAIGIDTLCTNTEGSCNVAIGYLALKKNTTGCRNTSIGRIALCSNTSGHHNIAVGDRAMVANTAGCCNVGIGVLAIRCQTTGGFNVGIGICSLFANLTSNNNTGIGAFALKCLTTGTQNTAIGRNSGCATTEGTQNTSVGANSFVCNTTGNYNANLGFNAGFFNTTGNYNTGIGYNANQDVTEANYNTAVGFYANRNTTTGNCNTALGGYALNTNTLGGNNVAIGMMSLCANTTSSNNVAVGKFALRNNTTANGNIAVGHSALCANTTATGNTAVGCEALKANTDQINNTAIGLQVLASNTTGSSNTGLGAQALLSNTSGYQNTAGGEAALQCNTSGLRNTALGYKASQFNTSGDCNVAVGCGALLSNSTADHNTAVGNSALENATAAQNTGIGSQAGKHITSGLYNTAVGFASLYCNSTGNQNTALGWCALFANTAANNTAVGAKSLCANTTGIRNTSIGDHALAVNTTGNYNVAVGDRTLTFNITAVGNTAVGYLANYCNRTGCYNTGLGYQTLFKNTEGRLNTAVGTNSLVCNTTGCFNTAVGNDSLGCNCTTHYNTAVGYLSLRCSTGSRVVGIGVSAGCRNSGNCNTFVGYEAGRFNCEGVRVTALGYQALGSGCNSGCNNTAVGALTLRSNTTGTGNQAFGYQSLECNTTGCLNTTVGQAALLQNVSGNYNVGIGSSAGSCNCTGHCNTSIGTNAGKGDQSGGCNISIGPLAACKGNGVCQNIAIGTCSLFLNASGSDNLMMGHLAGYATNAHNNMGIGTGALQCNDIGTQNVVIGRCAAQQNTSGGYNTVLGGSAFKNNTTGGFNVAIGNVALLCNTNASNNVAVGYGAAYNNTTASGTVAIGFYANYNNCTGIFTTAVGSQALQCNTGGCNTALGYCALHNNSSARRNTAVGMRAGVSTTTGCCNTIVGSEAFLSNTTGDKNVAIGQGSLYTTNGGAQNTTVGTSSMYYNTTGCFNTAVGKSALLCNTTGGNNVGIGLCTLACVETGCCNIAIGECAGHGVACVDGTIAIGHCALFTGPGSAATIAIGTFALKSLTTGVGNMTMGACSMCTATTACNNIGYGIQSQKNLTTGRYNTSFGFNTLAGNREGCYNTALGYLAGNGVFNGNLMCNTYVGACAGYSNCDGCSNVAVGCGALFSGVSDDKNVAIGQGSLYTTNGGGDNTAVGFKSLYNNTTGDYNTAVGFCSLVNNTTGIWNTAVGYHSGDEITTGTQNTIVGPYAGQKTASGTQNTYLGFAAGRFNVCGQNVAIGHNAARCQNDGSTALTCAMSGIYIGDSVRGAEGDVNSIVIGNKACSCGSNTVNIGNCNTTCTYINGGMDLSCSLTVTQLSATGTGDNYFGGNVGIGTTTPQKGLEIAKASTSGGGVIRLTGTGEASQNDVTGAIEFYNCDTTDNTPGVFGIIRGVAGPSGGEGSLQFLTDMPSEGTDACVVAMHIHSNGNVGIGTTTPGYALTIDDGDLLVCTANGGYFQVDESACAVKHSDSVKAMFGTGNDLQIYHNGSNSYIAQGGTGDLYITHNQNNADIRLQASAGSGTAVDYVILDSSQCAIRMKRQTKWDDNICATFGDGSDLCIYHNGTHNFVTAEGGDGSLYIRPGSGNTVQIEDKDGQDMITAAGAGAVNLYYNNSKKLETINGGVCVTGHVCACGNGYFSCVIAGGYFEEKAANPSLAEYPTGTIVSIGESGDLIKSTVKNDRKVFGVTQNGVCQPIVLGAEPVLVTGDIKIGDYITTSNKPGHGMKATCILHGAVIAQAMEAGCGDSHLVKAMIRKM